MITQVHSQYHATDQADAEAQALEVWRKFTGDPQAGLPWATTIHVQPSENVPAPPTPGQLNITRDPRPFFVDLIIKDNKSAPKAPPGV